MKSTIRESESVRFGANAASSGLVCYFSAERVKKQAARFRPSRNSVGSAFATPDFPVFSNFNETRLLTKPGARSIIARRSFI